MELQIIPTPFGPLRASWTATGQLASCTFSDAGAAADVTSQPQGDSRLVARQHALSRSLDEYFQRGVFRWDLDHLDWSSITPFRRAVLRACFHIPAGHTLSYGQLAAKAGKPRAARAVGGAMAGNPWPILIPCHRVVGAKGQLTGYSGNGGLETKRKLLDWELAAQSKAVVAREERLPSADRRPAMVALLNSN
ncbi:MAG: MGMT family protein [Planctomycetales bacterium]|nr:MGMT family protein [Planctomycetales bacterium]